MINPAQEEALYKDFIKYSTGDKYRRMSEDSRDTTFDCTGMTVSSESLSQSSVRSSSLDSRSSCHSGTSRSSTETSENERKRNNKITVQESKVAGYDKSGHPFYNKYQYCLFCGQGKAKLSRHFASNHSSEDEVIALSKMKGAVRNTFLQELTNAGNYRHNVDVLKQKQGEIVPVRRPPEGANKSYRLYKPCPDCHGFYQEAELWRHSANCEKNKRTGTKRHILKEAKALLFSATTGPTLKPNPAFDQMIARMRKRDLQDVIASDELLRRYGHWMMMKHETNKDQSHYITNKLRELARLVLYAREEEKNQSLTLQDLLKPEKFDDLVTYVKAMPKEGHSTSKRLGESLQKVIVVLKGHLMANGDNKSRRKVDHVEWQLTNMWQDIVAIPAQRALTHAKQSKPASLPFTEDVVSMANNLKKAIHDAYRQLLDGKMTVARRLMELILARIITFNKRR